MYSHMPMNGDAQPTQQTAKDAAELVDLTIEWSFFNVYSRTPLIRPPSESHWCGRIRGMVAREGFVYEQKPLSVTGNVVV